MSTNFWEEKYYRWLTYSKLDPHLLEELRQIAGNKAEIRERFNQSLTFGTGGLRGIMGAGTNRMNIYTVRKTTAGFARYLLSVNPHAKKQGVVIAYDNRHNSAQFATEVGQVLTWHGIQVFMFDKMRPTPQLSFAVRHLKAAAGIVITASHNPPEYNGYKVYGADGGQVVPDEADKIMMEIEKIHDELEVCYLDKHVAVARGMWQVIGQEMDEAYLEQLTENAPVIEQETNINIVYTPLHGTGITLVPEALKNDGFTEVHIVEEQSTPHPEFPAVTSPNPEDKAAFDRAIALGESVDADLLLATDPDADRVAAAVKDFEGNYTVLSGNQLGALLLDYILMKRHEAGTLPRDGAVVKTIVTSSLGQAIAERYGLTTFNTLTGFKYIAEAIRRFETAGTHTFVFGYEESCGYLITPFVRDKDGVQTCVYIAQMVAYYKLRGMTVYERLHRLYELYGYYLEELLSWSYDGVVDGTRRIEALVDKFRKKVRKRIAEQPIHCIKDYLRGTVHDMVTGEVSSIDLPRENVLYYTLTDGSSFCIRPSGTEPKVKLYLSVKADDESDARYKLDRLKASVLSVMESENDL